MNLSNILKVASLVLFASVATMLGGCAADTDTTGDVEQAVVIPRLELVDTDVSKVHQPARATSPQLGRELADKRNMAELAKAVAVTSPVKLPVAGPVDSVSFGGSPRRADFDNLIADEIEFVPAGPAPSPEVR